MPPVTISDSEKTRFKNIANNILGKLNTITSPSNPSKEGTIELAKQLLYSLYLIFQVMI